MAAVSGRVLYFEEQRATETGSKRRTCRTSDQARRAARLLRCLLRGRAGSDTSLKTRVAEAL